LSQALGGIVAQLFVSAYDKTAALGGIVALLFASAYDKTAALGGIVALLFASAYDKTAAYLQQRADLQQHGARISRDMDAC
jgi:hypothetical protein